MRVLWKAERREAYGDFFENDFDRAETAETGNVVCFPCGVYGGAVYVVCYAVPKYYGPLPDGNELFKLWGLGNLSRGRLRRFRSFVFRNGSSVFKNLRQMCQRAVSGRRAAATGGRLHWNGG